MINCTTPIQPDTELYYQAVGLVRGQYLPSQGSFSQGILLTEDGLMAPANLLGAATSLLERHEELLQQPHIWIVYPRTKLQPPHLQFALRAIRQPPAPEELEVVHQNIDYFTVRGLVTYIDDKAGNFVVRVYRNVKSSDITEHTKDKDDQLFLLTLVGIMPKDAYGQFWELRVHRQADRLILKDAKFIAQVFQPKKKPSKKRQTKKKL
ncbi:hypothetical protein [Aerosakkonema funiforme]|uniref:hypothetical protein n=1 Tax=Aerosakkonema funiforme TaxID=1246630 RepID=UPI0035B77D0C